MEFLKNSNWVWSSDWSSEDKDNPRILLFRKEIELISHPKQGQVQISADSRYKLYINEKLVEVGPSKGDRQIWYVDTMDITSYLKSGKNIIAVSVLRYPEELSKGNHSTFRTSSPGLFFVGTAADEAGRIYEFSADETWKCKTDEKIKIISEEVLFAPLWIHEQAQGNPEIFGWKSVSYDDKDWENVKPYVRVQMHGAISPGNLNKRTIPFMYRKKRKFQGIMDAKSTRYNESDWIDFINGRKEIVVPAHSEEIVEIDAGEEMTGYLHIAFANGAGAKVEILQAEAYVQDELCGPAHVPLKKDRLDKINGHLQGYTDTYSVAGLGNDHAYERYEPYWYRTFRFIQLKIVTGDETLHLKSFDYEETGYPLQVETSVETSDKSLKDIWDISERTLRRCMHETYEDCPFYEQLQYAMDSRQQILYTYAVSADDRLARKCMDDFKRSQRYDGLLNCCYPNCNPNIIPGFSIYYILMVYDHMMYFGDKDLITFHMTTINGILDFFDRHLTTEGYVDKIGGLNMESPFWSFIDWAEEWNPTTGVPPAGLEGPITMESLLYILGLQRASALADYLGKREEAGEYLNRASNVQEAILRFCMGSNGMIQDGPGMEHYSQQCQVFAVLTDTIAQDMGRKNLLKTIQDKSYTQCTVAMRYYLFRALEKTDLYEYTNQYWDAWRDMIANHCTTCVESESYARSECHAWGSLALYELPSTILGVRPAEPGYKKVRISPVLGYLDHASGCVKTPVGIIKVSWKKEQGSVKVDYEVPQNVEVAR